MSELESILAEIKALDLYVCNLFELQNSANKTREGWRCNLMFYGADGQIGYDYADAVGPLEALKSALEKAKKLKKEKGICKPVAQVKYDIPKLVKSEMQLRAEINLETKIDTQVAAIAFGAASSLPDNFFD